MSVDVGDGLAVSGSPSSSRSVGVSIPATGVVVRNSALGVSYEGTSPEATASTLLRSVKQGMENEEDTRKRRGKGVGGGKKLKDKSPRFVNANKHLIKKGILELDSRASDNNIHASSSTLPPSLPSTASRSKESLRPHSFCITSSNGLPGDVPIVNDIKPGGVLVAAARGSMRMLREQSPEDQQSVLCHPGGNPAGQLAFSPDSGYGNTPDAMRTQSSSMTIDGGGLSTQRLTVTSNHTLSRSSSGRTSSSESVGVMTVPNGSTSMTHTDPSNSFCGGNMSLSQGAKFTIGEAVNTNFFPVNSPSIPLPNSETTTERKDKSPNSSSSSSLSSVTQNSHMIGTKHLSPNSADTAHNYNPFSSNFALSPGPTERAQTFQFLNTTSQGGTTSEATRSISPNPTLSLSTNYRRHLQSVTPDRTLPQSTIFEAERLSGDVGGGDGSQQRVMTSQTAGPEWRERGRKKRSHSQPMVHSLDVKQQQQRQQLTTTTAVQKDYFQVTDELSRENSHFSLSEALLTVVEQYKANTTEALQESVRGEREQMTTEYSDILPTTTSEFYSTSPPPRSWGSLSSIATEDSVDGFSLQKHTPKISLLELLQFSGNVHTAESTAQRLLQFIATQYSGVESEDITNGHNMLTLPVDFLYSLNQDEDLQKSVTTSTQTTRGDKDWAPPRAQIIFHIKSPSRNIMKQVAAQGYRCTGCGMRQDPSQARSFRFCNYTGKYFCQKCHTNAPSVIPAYILDRWSFKKYYVSNFARDLLERIHYEPVFDVQNVNPNIYSMVPVLTQARDLRTQLVAVKKYLKTCRQAQSLTATFDGYIPWTADVHTYSIDDFLQIKLKLRYLRSLLSDSIKHIKSCPLCQGKGFVCEFCGNPEIIFPFELNKVSKCPHCQCCFHKTCFNTQPCPRCIRMRQRERRRRTEDYTTDTSTGD